jgi:hypothetical protein
VAIVGSPDAIVAIVGSPDTIVATAGLSDTIVATAIIIYRVTFYTLSNLDI